MRAIYPFCFLLLLLLPSSASAAGSPVLSQLTPVAGAQVSGTQQVSVNASDPDGIRRVSFYAGTQLLGVDTVAPYTLSWDTKGSNEGTHILKAVATDNSPEKTSGQIRHNIVVKQLSSGRLLWQGSVFCAYKSLHGSFGMCASGPWDVSGCVAPPSGQPAWSLTRSPDSGGGEVGRFEVRQGDQGAAGGGDRCELVQQTRAITGMAAAPGQPATPDGEERVFEFQSLYDASLQLPSSLQYQTLAQWHNSSAPPGCPTSSPLKLALTGGAGAKRLEIHGQQCVRGVTSTRQVMFSAPLPVGQWQSWSFRIRWSSDPALGYVQVSLNGSPLALVGADANGRLRMATRYSDRNGIAVFNHFKLGNYRDKSITQPTVVSYRRMSILQP